MIQQLLNDVNALQIKIENLLAKFDKLQLSLFPVLTLVSNPDPPDERINVKYAAQILNVSTKTVERYAKQGLLSCDKPAGLCYYSKNEVVALAKFKAERK